MVRTEPIVETRPMLADCTVIIPTLGRETLTLCLEALIAGTRWPAELILVDQGDNALVAESARAVAARGIPVRHLRAPRRGPGAARNRGIEQVHTRFFAAIDDDCVPDQNWLEQMAHELATHPQALVTGRVNPAGDSFTPSLVTSDVRATYTRPTVRGSDPLASGNMGMALQTIQAIGLFDEDATLSAAAEDNDLGYRALRCGAPIIYAPDVIVCHLDWRDIAQLPAIYRGYAWGQGAFFGKYLRRGDRLIAMRMVVYLTRGTRLCLAGLLRRDPNRFAEGAARFTHFLPGLVAGLRRGPVREKRIIDAPSGQVAVKKVCMLVHQYYERDPRVRRYGKALSDAGFQVDVIALRSHGRQNTTTIDGVHVYMIPLQRGMFPRKNYLIEYAVALFLFTVWLTGLFMRKRYDVVHVHNMPDFLVFAALVPRLCGAKIILDIHDSMPEVYASKYKVDHAGNVVRLMRLQERYATRFAHAVIAANQNFHANLIKRGVVAEKLIVVNNVADPAVFDRSLYPRRQRQPDEPFVLIYPGTIAPRYGLDIAISALPRLVEPIPHIRLRIIGPTVDYVDTLRELACKLGVDQHVEFLPLIPVHEVPAQIARADIGVYPARLDVHMANATPTKVLEFAAMGIPVVASRLRILEQLFGDRALAFFMPEDVAGFARCVLELYTDPARRAELVRTADDMYVRRYAWQNERDTYFSLLQCLIPTSASVWLNK